MASLKSVAQTTVYNPSSPLKNEKYEGIGSIPCLSTPVDITSGGIFGKQQEELTVSFPVGSVSESLPSWASPLTSVQNGNSIHHFLVRPEELITRFPVGDVYQEGVSE